MPKRTTDTKEILKHRRDRILGGGNKKAGVQSSAHSTQTSRILKAEQVCDLVLNKSLNCGQDARGRLKSDQGWHPGQSSPLARPQPHQNWTFIRQQRGRQTSHKQVLWVKTIRNTFKYHCGYGSQSSGAQKHIRLSVWCQKHGITIFGLYCPLRKFTYTLDYEQDVRETQKCLFHCPSARKAEPKSQSFSSPLSS